MPFMLRLVVLLPLLMTASFAPLSAKPGDEQQQLRREMRAGNVLSLRQIEDQVLPTMRGMQYLTAEFDPVALAYRLKFLKDGRVSFVDVDARTGSVLARH